MVDLTFFYLRVGVLRYDGETCTYLPVSFKWDPFGHSVKSNNNNNNSHDNVYGAVIMTQSHCESSPGSSDECRLSAGWPPTLRPSLGL